MSSTALAERPALAPTVTQEQMQLVKQTVANGATDAELKLYLYDCARQGVHPLDRMLHFTKRGGKYTPVTSIDLMRTRAADTGEYAGSDDAVFTGTSKEEDFAASVTVYRLVQSQRCAFTATARWAEYKPDSAHMWQRMPHTMLAKCAEALALRKGFPRQLAGLYAAEEMDQADRGQSFAPTQEGPQTVIDVQSGEQVSADDAPEPPPGYHYVRGYSVSNNGWHEATLLKWDDQGGSFKVSTKREQIGALLAEANREGLPVKAEVTPKANRVGEGYVNKVSIFKPAAPQPPIEVAASDMPF
ncbi:MAG TPA: phage recombination protein Bet [Vicinamibacterales bacterium]